MRILTLHPQYLDAAGLVALWREALFMDTDCLLLTSGQTRECFIGLHFKTSALDALPDLDRPEDCLALNQAHPYVWHSLISNDGSP